MGSTICTLQGSLVRVEIIETEMEAGVGREIGIRCEGRYFSVWVYNLCSTTKILFFCMNLSEGPSLFLNVCPQCKTNYLQRLVRAQKSQGPLKRNMCTWSDVWE